MTPKTFSPVRLPAAIFAALLLASRLYAAEPIQNLARQAHATASETLDDLTPQKAIDGNLDTRWSGISGHNSGVWFQLDWDKPIDIGEVVIRQYDTFVMTCDVQVQADKDGPWGTIEHFGKPDERLPKIIACRFTPRKATAIRIANITNGPSFDEVEVHDRPFAGGIVTRMASDLRGNFVGVVTDALGVMPVDGAAVKISGTSKAGDWEQSAQSDAHGLFSAPMPLGLNGPVKTQAQLKTKDLPVTQSEAQADASDFAFRLTPREARENSVDLGGKWKFSFDPANEFSREDFDDKDWQEIDVPAHWVMEKFHNLSGVAGYRRTFKTPQEGGRVKLCFDGVYSGAEVWVNGRRVAAHEGGFTPFEVDVTDLVYHQGENVLAVRVREHTLTSDHLDKMSVYANFPLAGIIRPVHLFTVPSVHVGGVEVATQFDADYHNATVQIHDCVMNESAEPYKGEIEFDLEDSSKTSVAKSNHLPIELRPWESKEIEASLPVNDPKTWTAESPNLYALSAHLTNGEKTTEQFATRIGVRQTDIRGSEMLINGQPVKFRGTCHHDSQPLLGRAVTPEVERKDLELMKEANLNAVRTSHYPPLAELPDIADELGIYVEDEASFCWVRELSDDLRNTPHIIQMTAELLARDRNHPSVTHWSLCNESYFGYGFQRSHDWVRSADPTRPNSAAISAWLEIATMHNPITVALIRQNENLKQPLLYDESLCIYQGIFNDQAELWVDPGMRDYYVEPLPAIYDAMMKSKVMQGSFIWCWSDDIFCVPGRGVEFGRGVTSTRCNFLEADYGLPSRGIVGDAPWGVVDGWRRKKPEFWITKKLHSPIKVKEGPIALPAANEPLHVAVENQYDFRNLSEVKIEWKIGDTEGTVKANVPARSTGDLVIRPGRAVREGEVVAVNFTEQNGQLIDAYRLPVGHEEVAAPPIVPLASGSLQITDEGWLSGDNAVITGKDFQIAIDRETGLLRRCIVNGSEVLSELPTLHILPTDRPLEPLPDRLSWHLEKFGVKKDGENVVVSIQGQYQNYQGGYEITITPAGKLTVGSSFVYSGEEFNAREIGLRLSMPRDCSTLEWNRKAEWSVYPPDHIGRPRGTAVPFPNTASDASTTGRPLWGPARPWSEDFSPMGSNDFRSTKRNIEWVAMHYPGGPGALIIASGQQHARAICESDRISLHVNDWFGGTNVGAIEWVSNYGKGKTIHKSERLNSKTIVQLFPQLRK